MPGFETRASVGRIPIINLRFVKYSLRMRRAAPILKFPLLKKQLNPVEFLKYILVHWKALQMVLGPKQNSVQGDQDAQEAEAPGPSAAAIPPTQSGPGESAVQQPAGQGAHIEADVRKSILIISRTSDTIIVDRGHRFRVRQ